MKTYMCIQFAVIFYDDDSAMTRIWNSALGELKWRMVFAAALDLSAGRGNPGSECS